MIIALVNKKGGAGKTTSCAYIAMCLHSAGHKVTGIDTDSNLSFANWAINAELPFGVLQSNKLNLTNHLKELDGYVVIDTPPNDEGIIYKVASLADEIIIPLSPTEQDINQLEETLQIVTEIEQMRDKKVKSVLLTRFDVRLGISKQAQQDLQNMGVPVCDNVIRSLQAYVRMNEPTYLDEYRAFLSEVGVLDNA